MTTAEQLTYPLELEPLAPANDDDRQHWAAALLERQRHGAVVAGRRRGATAQGVYVPLTSSTQCMPGCPISGPDVATGSASPQSAAIT